MIAGNAEYIPPLENIIDAISAKKAKAKKQTIISALINIKNIMMPKITFKIAPRKSNMIYLHLL